MSWGYQMIYCFLLSLNAEDTQYTSRKCKQVENRNSILSTLILCVQYDRPSARSCGHMREKPKCLITSRSSNQRQRKIERSVMATTCACESDTQGKCWGRIKNDLEEKLGRKFMAWRMEWYLYNIVHQLCFNKNKIKTHLTKKEWSDKKNLMHLRNEKSMRATIIWSTWGHN